MELTAKVPPLVPKIVDLLNPCLKALHDLGGSASNDELPSKVIEILQVPQDIAEIPKNSGKGSMLAYRLAWAKDDLENYGLVVNSSQIVWALNEIGQDPLTVEPEEVLRTVRRMKYGPNAKTATEVQEEESVVETQSQTWQEQLLDLLYDIPPDAFERLCKRLFRESGFHQVEVTGRSGDGGIDGVWIVRLSGILSFPVVFQCKRYRNSVSPSVVRDFRGAMVGRADKGIIITTGLFTRDARREATRDGSPPIDLIDGEALVEKLKELKLGIHTRMVEEIQIERDFFDGL